MGAWAGCCRDLCGHERVNLNPTLALTLKIGAGVGDGLVEVRRVHCMGIWDGC